MTDLVLDWLAPLLLALVPAGVQLVVDRRLAQTLDDPLLPERLAARGRPVGLAIGLSVAGLVWWRSEALAWAVPLAIVAVSAAAFPLRRRLLDERWSLLAYLSFVGRSTLAIAGFWFVLALTPVLTNWLGWAAWVSTAGLGALLLAWNERFADVLRALMRAEPLDDHTRTARFAALVGRTALPMPRFDVVPLRGGVIANALALPSLRRSGVLFTDTLLTRFTPDEVTAVCAHELAHLEQFHPRRLQQLRLSTAALVVVGLAYGPLVRALGYRLTWPWMVGFAALVLGYLVTVTIRRQQHETAGDLRAVELIGDPEPLVTALIKLHALARLPRRWDQATEQHQSHPSLARRIAAIRQGVPSPAAAADDESDVFTAADGSGATVRFDPDRLVWSEAEGAAHSLPYPTLTELRAMPGRAGAARLLARDARGREWSLPLHSADGARVQRALDAVDRHVAYGRVPVAAHPVVRLVAALAALIALGAGQVVAALVVFAGSATPSAATMAAAGGAASAAALLLARDGQAGLFDRAVPMALALALSSVLLAVAAWRARETPVGRGARSYVWVLVIGTLLAAALIVPSAPDVTGLHLASRTWTLFAVLGPAAAAALLTTSSRWRVPVATTLAVGALGSLVAGSTAFLEKVSGDPFLAAAPPVHDGVLGDLVEEMELPTSASRVLLSPGGLALAIVEGDGEGVQRFHVARLGRSIHTMTADQAAFLDDDELVTMEQVGRELVVRRIGVDDPARVRWEWRMPPPSQARLFVDGASGRWRVAGYEPKEGYTAWEVSGTDALAATGRWAHDAIRGAMPVAIDTETLIALEIGISARAGLLWTMPWAGLPRFPSTLWRLRDSERTRVAGSAFLLACGDALDAGMLTCVLQDGTGSRLVQVDSDFGRVIGLARLDVELLAPQFHGQWVTGISSRGDHVAIHGPSRTQLRAPEVPDEYPTAMAAAVGRVAVLSETDRGSIVRVYDTEPR